jgi:hypothetical protein
MTSGQLRMLTLLMGYIGFQQRLFYDMEAAAGPVGVTVLLIGQK